MSDIPDVFSSIDLLWSEGAAYDIGFTDALSLRKAALRTGGFAVVGVVCGRGRNTTLSDRAVYTSDHDNFHTIGIFGGFRHTTAVG
ncbi:MULTISPECIES: hypothetical protein [unclassified Ensifer]|uniref:hypothetical protein n=1 Tax=unclassified Ensifer TaxID=2633371 RepID=UPI000812FB33|nr:MULTISPECIES: hypothetical protein [unclassified Ensifer]OCP24775.1 hypothetical protein BC361_19400 [Ensifer sp. LC54]OCP25886.1 hypothetical protein BC363_19135 [Ensifer sp. LC384]OCP36027.1 hypothetical protein BC360_26060 [Ensifer sp. LC163]